LSIRDSVTLDGECTAHMCRYEWVLTCEIRSVGLVCGPQLAVSQRKASTMPRLTVFAVFAIGLMLVLSACSSDDSYPTSTAVVSGADDATAAEFQTVNDTYDLYNTGDIEAWVEVRDAGSVWPADVDRDAAMEEIVQGEQANYDGGARYVETECVSHGLDDWPEIADEGLASGHYFTCNAVYTLDYENSDLTGVVDRFDWVVTDGVVVAVSSSL
jgi:hypothetical protein